MLTPCIATALCLLPMTVIAAIAGPSQADLYALLGVAPATVIVMFNVLKKERSFALAASVFCGAGCFGAFAPGIMVHYWLKMPLDSIIWQLWMGLGFFAAIFGWFITQSSLKIAASFSPWMMNKFFRDKLGYTEDDKERHERHENHTNPRNPRRH